MRGSSLKILEHWAIHELYIPPFLAPAVFAPWLYSSQHQSAQPTPLEILRPILGFRGSPARKNTSGKARSSLRQYEHQAVQQANRIQNVKSPSTPVGRRCFSSCGSRRKESCTFDNVYTGNQIEVDVEMPSQCEDTRDRKYNDAGEAEKDLTKSGHVLDRTIIDLEEEKNSIKMATQDELPDEDRILRQRLEELRLRASLTDDGLQEFDAPLGQHSMHFAIADSHHTDHSSTWIEGIARLTNRLSQNSGTTEDSMFQFGKGGKPAWVDLLPHIGSTSSQIKDAWESIPPKTRSIYWPVAMLSYMEQSTPYALTFLNATIMEPLPPPFQIAGSIHLIALYFYQQASEVSSYNRINYLNTVEKILEHYKPPPAFTRRSLRLLLKFFPTRAESFLSMLQDNRVQLHHNLLLQFANMFANSGKLTQSIDTLKEAIAHGADTDSLVVLQLCTKLLRLSRGQGGDYQSSSSTVAALLDMGIRLNIVMFNALLLNASEAGDPGTAWGIYGMMRKNYVEPDEYTYTIMMNMCRKTHQKQEYRALYFELDPEEKEIHPILVTEILACRHHFNRRQNFDHSLRFYERHCDLQPLRDLGVVAPDHNIRYESYRPYLDDARPSPCAGTLGMMLLAFMKRSQRLRKIDYVYKNFQRLLREEDPSILPLVATTHTYNLFLKAYGRSSGSLSRWRDIVRHMVRPFPPYLVNRETGEQVKGVRPDAQTWNIIVNALSRAGHHADATKLLKVMKSNNIQPDVVTWNSLLNGFARQQRAFDVAHTLQKMESANIRPDEHTRRALLRLTNQARLMSKYHELEIARQNLPAGETSEDAAEPATPETRNSDEEGGVVGVNKGAVRDIEGVMQINRSLLKKRRLAQAVSMWARARSGRVRKRKKGRGRGRVRGRRRVRGRGRKLGPSALILRY